MNPALVSRSLNGSNDDTEGINQQFLSFGIQREVVVQSHITTQQCEDDISDLKVQLDEKEKELERLTSKIKLLEKKNSELEAQLKTKCTEVTSLRERITKLESEKKTLEEELSKVKLSLKNIKEEVGDLTKSKEAQGTTNEHLDGELRKVRESLKDVEEDLKASKDLNKQLKQEIQQVKRQQRYVKGAPARLPVQVNSQHTAMKCLAEMACYIINAIYSMVLPEFFTPVVNYTMKLLEEDIESMPKTEEEKKKATERWEEVKQLLSLTDQKSELLCFLQNSRSPSELQEHLDESLLRAHTEYLHKENILKGRLDFESIKSLIEVWKNLNKRPSALKTLKN